MLSHGARLAGRCLSIPHCRVGGEEGRSAADISGSSAKGLEGEDDNQRGGGPAARQHCGAAGCLCPRQRLPIRAQILVQSSSSIAQQRYLLPARCLTHLLVSCSKLELAELRARWLPGLHLQSLDQTAVCSSHPNAGVTFRRQKKNPSCVLAMGSSSSGVHPTLQSTELTI